MQKRKSGLIQVSWVSSTVVSHEEVAVVLTVVHKRASLQVKFSAQAAASCFVFRLFVFFAQDREIDIKEKQRERDQSSSLPVHPSNQNEKRQQMATPKNEKASCVNFSSALRRD